MNRRLADRLAALAVVVLLAIGLYGSWQAYRQAQATDRMMGSMMDGSMGGMGTTDPLWTVLVTVVAVVVVGGVYVAVRDDLTDPPGEADGSLGGPTGRTGATGAHPDQSTSSPSGTSTSAANPTTGPASSNGRRLLDVLPEDERRVLEPVLTSPGLTQIELRDRADFSKSKVSQTVSALEKRGLLYRERQGRTFRVYPDESVADAAAE